MHSVASYSHHHPHQSVSSPCGDYNQQQQQQQQHLAHQYQTFLGQQSSQVHPVLPCSTMSFSMAHRPSESRPSAAPADSRLFSPTASAFTAPPATAAAAGPHAITMRVRPTAERLVVKLSVRLMDTYSGINERYYANKRLKQEQAHAAAAAAAGQHASAYATAAPAHPDQQRLGWGIPARKGETNDGWSDRDYNYITTEDEMMGNGRYQVSHSIGKGSFGRVVRAWDHRERKWVAIKVVKAKAAFFKQAQIEMKLLNSVTRGFVGTTAVGGASATGGAATPSDSSSAGSSQSEGDKWNIVTLLDSFMHHGHQCLVFELLSLNLYELLKNTGFTGISLKLIGKFTHQLLMTLAYLSCKERGDERIIHCDLKPENVLLRHKTKSAIKLIDLGSACYTHQKVYTYIQSRFYRAPEVIISAGYNAAIDMWSLGCMCFELCLGTPLFDGQDEHDQIIRQADLLGIPPVHMIENSKKGTKFFEMVPKVRGPTWRPSYHADGEESAWQLRDPQLSGSMSNAAAHTYARLVMEPRATMSSTAPPLSPMKKLCRRLALKFDQKNEHPDLAVAFCDLLLQMLEWDPKLRINPGTALHHEFFNLLKRQADGQQAAAAAAATATAPTGAVSPASTTSSTAYWAPKPAAAAAAPSQPHSSISEAAAKAFMHQAPAAVVPLAPASQSAGPAGTHSSADSTMSEASSGPAGPPPAAVSAAETTAPMITDSQGPSLAASSGTAAAGAAPAAAAAAATAADTSMDTSDDSADSRSKHLASKATLAVQVTPTRKRHSASSPRSPGSVQGTPKTRALGASSRHLSADSSPMTRAPCPQMQASPLANAPPSQHPDSEIERMQLPQAVYQSPSTGPVTRNLRRQNSARSAPGHGAFFFGSPSTSWPAAGSTLAAGLPPRRLSENSQADPPSPAVSAYRTRSKNALLTPPLGASTPMINGISASNLTRELASDPLALHLTSPSIQPQAGSLAAVPDIPSHAPQVFVSPQTLRRHRYGMATQSRPVDVDPSSEEDSTGPPSARTRRGRSLAQEQEANMQVDEDGAHRPEKENRAEAHNSSHAPTRRSVTANCKPPAQANGPTQATTAPTTPSRTRAHR